MSEYELRVAWHHLRSLPYSRIQWHEEVIGPDALPIHSRYDAGTPDEAVDRWRALLFRCRTDRHWYAARLTVIEPPPGELPANRQAS